MKNPCSRFGRRSRPNREQKSWGGGAYRVPGFHPHSPEARWIHPGLPSAAAPQLVQRQWQEQGDGRAA